MPSVNLFMERSVEIKYKSSASGKMALNQCGKTKKSQKMGLLLSVNHDHHDYDQPELYCRMTILYSD